MIEVPQDRNSGSGDNNAAEGNGNSGQKTPVLIAVDLGAESCPVSLLRWIDGHPEIRLVHRFANSANHRGNGLRWDITAICESLEEGLRGCAQLTPEGIASIGVEERAVDYVRRDAGGKPVADPFCYRDKRSVAALNLVHARIPPARLYKLTGVQILTLNNRRLPYVRTASAMDHHARRSRGVLARRVLRQSCANGGAAMVCRKIPCIIPAKWEPGTSDGPSGALANRW